MKKIEKFLFKNFFYRINFFIYLLAIYIRLYIKRLNFCKNKKNILLFSYVRWKEDAKLLIKEKNYNYYFINDIIVEKINAIIKNIANDINKDIFLKKIIFFLNKVIRIDCCITCSVWYKREKFWSKAFSKNKIPFIANHKEFTIDDDRFVKKLANRAILVRYKFHGSMVCVNNINAKKILIDSKISEQKKIHLTGLIRADNLYKKENINKVKNLKKKSVTLFSFGELAGPFDYDIEECYYYFSLNRNIGFIELFKNVHLSFVESALENPDINYYIKLKYFEDWWMQFIEDVIKENMNISLKDIPNCKIVNVTAQKLMVNSCANIVFNSTTVLESRILGCNTIIPIFDEAIKEHKNKIYFYKYLDLFTIAKSKQDLKNKINLAINGKKFFQGSIKKVKKMSNYYLGNSDGKSTQRFLKKVEESLA